MRWIFVAVMLLVPIPSMAGFKIPKIPRPGNIEIPIKIPGLDKILREEPAVSTSFEDAITGVPYYDDFNPPVDIAMAEMPRGIDHSFMLAPGGYEVILQSYCLHAGTHGPGSGEGYLFAPLKGKLAGVINDILRNSVAHPEIPQQNIQTLIWGIQARTKISEMSDELQEAARKLLSRSEIRKLNGGALAQIPEELMDKAFGSLPPFARQVFEAEARIRGLLSQGVSDFDAIEGIAVLPGEPEGGGEEVPRGRWSYQPGGFFVRYFPDGYSRTRTQVFVPPAIQVETDLQGRITAVYDETGHRIEADYADEPGPVAIPGDNSVKAYAFSAIRIIGPNREGLDNDVNLTDTGFTLVGMPSGDGHPERASGRFSGLAERYKWASAHREDLTRLVESVRKVGEKPASEDDARAIMEQMMDLADLHEAIKQAAEASGADEWTINQLDLVKQAWGLGLVTIGDVGGTQAQEEGGQTGQLGSGRILLASLQLNPTMLIARRGSLFGGSPYRPLRPFRPYGSATPANRGRQRLGLSPLPSFNQEDAGAPEDDKDNGSDKDALNKAKSAIDAISTGKDVFDAVTDPAGFVAGKIGFGIQDKMMGSYFDWLFGTASEISQALGGDPPRDDFRTIATLESISMDGSWGEDVPPARAAALDALKTALEDLVAKLRAGQVSVDRLGGAVQAGDEEWTQKQGAVLLRYKRDAGAAMIVVADRLDALLDELQAEGLNDIIITADAYRAYQQRLRAEGFTAEEIAAAHAVGLTDEQIQAALQERLAADPDEMAGSLMEQGREAASAMRILGRRWSRLPDVPLNAVGVSISG